MSLKKALVIGSDGFPQQLQSTDTLEGLGISGTLKVDTSGVGNVGSGEDNLIVYTVPGSTLANNQDYIEFTVGGTITGSINNKRIRIKFGSTTLFDTGNLAVASNADWSAWGLIIRTSATTFICIVDFTSSFASLLSSADFVSGTETLSNGLDLKCTGEATATDEVRQEFLLVKIGSYSTVASSGGGRRPDF